MFILLTALFILTVPFTVIGIDLIIYRERIKFWKAANAQGQVKSLARPDDYIVIGEVEEYTTRFFPVVTVDNSLTEIPRSAIEGLLGNEALKGLPVDGYGKYVKEILTHSQRRLMLANSEYPVGGYIILSNFRVVDSGEVGVSLANLFFLGKDIDGDLLKLALVNESELKTIPKPTSLLDSIISYI